MEETPTLLESFERLGLGPEADAREMRRAYARELKLIDQVHDAAGFQQLRAAYEAVLQLAAQDAAGNPSRAAKDGILAGPVHAAIRRAAPAAGEDSADAAQAVLQRLGAVVPRLRSQEDAQAALIAELRGDALINLAARREFEDGIAQCLLQAWRPGHEYLFPAAANVFNWIGDVRRLACPGDDGWKLDVATDQWLMFEQQPRQQRHAQREVMERMRLDKDPTRSALRHFQFHFETLSNRFPALVAVSTPAGSTARWQALYAGMARPAAHDQAVYAAEEPRASFLEWCAAVIIAITCMIGVFY